MTQTYIDVASKFVSIFPGSTYWSNFILVGVTIGLEQTEFKVEEGDVVEVYAVQINGILEREVTVTLRTGDRTATSGGMLTLKYVVS